MSVRVRLEDGEHVMKGEAVRAAASKARKSKAEAVVFSPYLIRRHRERLCEWVKANGLDPTDIPDDHPVRVEEGEGGWVIRYRAFVRDEQGRRQTDPNDSNQFKREERTAPCTVPPPDLGAPERGAKADT